MVTIQTLSPLKRKKKEKPTKKYKWYEQHGLEDVASLNDYSLFMRS
jgi:hypothetical protein